MSAFCVLLSNSAQDCVSPEANDTKRIDPIKFIMLLIQNIVFHSDFVFFFNSIFYCDFFLRFKLDFLIIIFTLFSIKCPVKMGDIIPGRVANVFEIDIRTFAYPAPISKWFTPNEDQGKPPNPIDKFMQIIKSGTFVVSAIITIKNA